MNINNIKAKVIQMLYYNIFSLIKIDIEKYSIIEYNIYLYITIIYIYLIISELKTALCITLV